MLQGGRLTLANSLESPPPAELAIAPYLYPGKGFTYLCSARQWYLVTRCKPSKDGERVLATPHQRDAF